jgi:hypothetical protein
MQWLFAFHFNLVESGEVLSDSVVGKFNLDRDLFLPQFDGKADAAESCWIFGYLDMQH